MRVLITNVYSYKNKGDAAIVISLVQEVKRVFKKPEILIQTADVKHDEGKYGEPVSSSLLWVLLSSVRDKFILTRLAVLGTGFVGLTIYLLLYKWIRLSPAFLLSKDLKQFVAENKQADMVIACGGGYLRTASGKPSDVILLATTCLNFLAARYLGKQVYLYSQSIGPVHGGLQHKILKFALSRVSIIEPREDVSIKFLEKLAPRAPIVPTADPALLLGGNGTFPKDVVKLDPKRLHVGLTVRKWFKDAKDLEHYIRTIAQEIDYLITKHNAEVFYVPQVIAENFGDDDRIIARRVWDKVKQKDHFTIVEADLHPFEIIGLCGRMDIFIGTRMHSNIFALISKVPVVAIEYEHKTRGIMRGLGLEPLTIDIKDITFELLRDKVEMLLNDRQHYVGLIEKNLPTQIKQSQYAIEAIKNAYQEKTA